MQILNAIFAIPIEILRIIMTYGDSELLAELAKDVNEKAFAERALKTSLANVTCPGCNQISPATRRDARNRVCQPCWEKKPHGFAPFDNAFPQRTFVVCEYCGRPHNDATATMESVNTETKDSRGRIDWCVYRVCKNSCSRLGCLICGKDLVGWDWLPWLQWNFDTRLAICTPCYEKNPWGVTFGGIGMQTRMIHDRRMIERSERMIELLGPDMLD
jgi:hypothetical protein